MVPAGSTGLAPQPALRRPSSILAWSSGRIHGTPLRTYSRSMPAPRYCRIRSICWMPDMQTKFVEANGLRFEVLEQGTGVRLALCLHGFPEHAISWRHQIPVLAGMGWSLTSAAG